MIAMFCIKIFCHVFSFHFESNLSHVRFLSFDEWLYVSTFLIYIQDVSPSVVIYIQDLSPSVSLDTRTFSLESISVFLSTFICRIYK